MGVGVIGRKYSFITHLTGINGRNNRNQAEFLGSHCLCVSHGIDDRLVFRMQQQVDRYPHPRPTWSDDCR